MREIKKKLDKSLKGIIALNGIMVVINTLKIIQVLFLRQFNKIQFHMFFIIVSLIVILIAVALSKVVHREFYKYSYEEEQ